MPNVMTKGGVLPFDPALRQENVQGALEEVHRSVGNLDAPLAELQRWSNAVGYFDHLTAENDYLYYWDDQTDVELRLQLNYSRLAYRPPDVPRTVDCPLCFENIGTPGKELLRVFEFELAGTPYFSHLTPFPLHPGHFVLNVRRHESMRVARQSVREAADFLRQAPGWLLASNSDVAWAGASVLGHHHFQIFRSLHLPIEDARALVGRREGNVRLDVLRWHAPSARISGQPEAVVDAAGALIERWKATEIGKATCNLLARQTAEGLLVIHLIFRHPDYRRPVSLLPIKSEGVGIIEMAGEVIVPPVPSLTREENRHYFQEMGLETARGIIGGNSPRDARHDEGYFRSFILGTA